MTSEDGNNTHGSERNPRFQAVPFDVQKVLNSLPQEDDPQSWEAREREVLNSLLVLIKNGGAISASGRVIKPKTSQYHEPKIPSKHASITSEFLEGLQYEEYIDDKGKSSIGFSLNSGGTLQPITEVYDYMKNSLKRVYREHHMPDLNERADEKLNQLLKNAIDTRTHL